MTLKRNTKLCSPPRCLFSTFHRRRTWFPCRCLCRRGLLPQLYPHMTMRAHGIPARVVGGQQKTLGVGREEAWWSSSVGSCKRYMYWGFTGPASVSWGPAVAKLAAIRFSAVLRDAALLPRVLSRTLCPIGNGLCQPDI